MDQAIAELVALFDLDQVSDDGFRTRAVETLHRRIYGGQLVGQALTAAGLTVDQERPVHSLHAYFVSGGLVTEPIELAVGRIRDSGTFSTRRVVARQGGRTLLSLEASFQLGDEAPGETGARPDVAPPGEMVPIDDWLLSEALPDPHDNVPHFVDAIDYRQAHETLGGPGRPWSRGLSEPRRDVWMRTRGRLPDGPLLHACVVAYASDKPLLGTTVLSPPLCGDPRNHVIASLDHSMWFHRPCRADEWLLARFDSAITGAGRARASAELLADDGTLAVTTIQEGLLRERRAGG